MKQIVSKRKVAMIVLSQLGAISLFIQIIAVSVKGGGVMDWVHMVFLATILSLLTRQLGTEIHYEPDQTTR